MNFIKGTRNGCFRTGQWAKINGVVMSKDDAGHQLCFVVEFIDGYMDEWPIYSSGYGYEFSDGSDLHA